MNRESDAADRTNFAGFLIRSFFVCCYAYFVPMLEKIINRHVCLADYDKKRIRICANTSLLLLLTIPGYLVSGEYQRLLYGMLFVYYALFAEFRFIKFEKAYVQRFHVVVVFWIIVIFTAWYYMFSMTSHDVMATLKDNLLFK